MESGDAGEGVFGDELDLADEDDEEIEVLIPDDTFLGEPDDGLDDPLFEDGPIGEARTSSPPVSLASPSLDEEPGADEDWFTDESSHSEPSAKPVLTALREPPRATLTLAELEPMTPGPDLDAELAELDAELAELEIELAGDAVRPTSSWQSSDSNPYRKPTRPKPALSIPVNVERPPLGDMLGLSNSMVEELAATIGETVDQASLAEVREAAPGSTPDFVDEAVELDVQDLILEGEARAPGGSLMDPPGHPVICLNEQVETPLGDVHLFTEDRAPERATIRRIVRGAAGQTRVDEVDYEHLLSPDGRAIEPGAVTRRVETLHQEARKQLESSGIEGLNWPEPAKGQL